MAIGAVAGAVAVVGGLVIGPALPGADADPLLDVRGIGPNNRSYRVEPPLARIGENFVGGAGTEVFTVRSPRDEYWRVAALDTYESTNGGEWTLTAQGGSEVQSGLHGAVDGSVLRQEFRITGLGDRWLPAAYRPVQVEGADEPLVVKSSSTLVANRSDVRDGVYTVSSRVPPEPTALTPEQIADTAAPVPSDLRVDTRLPGDFPSDVRATAQRITAGATTPYQRAQALEQFFRDPTEGFQYSLDVDLGPAAQSESAISQFLKSRVGFCVQFASSFVAMARSVGLPARVAVGYTSGRYDSTSGVYRVSTDNAHAWGEVWLAGIGWTQFEPTPPSNLPGGSPGAGSAPAASGPAASTPATTVPAASTPSATTVPAPGNTARVAIGEPPTGKGGRGAFTLGWWFGIALLVGAIAGAFVVACLIVVAKRRRRRDRHDRPDPAAAITGAWEEVLDRLGEVGVARQPSRTPLEVAAYAPERVPGDAVVPLRHLAEAYSAARYGPTPPDTDVVRQAWRDAQSVSSALQADAGVRERWRRRLDPTPLRRSTPPRPRRRRARATRSRTPAAPH
jgi:transglutaminase-like putative cysteine protease